jgi:hypothetical protein
MTAFAPFQQIAFKNLVERNKEREKWEGAPAPNSAIQVNLLLLLLLLWTAKGPTLPQVPRQG